MGQLTTGEREFGAAVLILLSIIGIAMAAVGRYDPLGIHGAIVLFYSVGLLFLLISGSFASPPDPQRFSRYYDDPIKVGVCLTLLWAILGMFVGVWAAAQLAWPSLNFDTSWASFGRIRPAHTTGVIFGFGGNALLTTSFHVVQRTSRARLADQFSPWFVLLGFNLFLLVSTQN